MCLVLSPPQPLNMAAQVARAPMSLLQGSRGRVMRYGLVSQFCSRMDLFVHVRLFVVFVHVRPLS